ncbi:MAG: hypothetical protein JJU40_11105 [Rhodobacteraceae bacterium]|nr:hypothetical protein [Paracoccaceae bacterium]
MNTKFAIHDLPEEFPEEDFLRDGPMRHEIIVMTVEALNRQGYPDLSTDTIWSKSDHRDAAVGLLEDCRPLPIVLELIDDLRAGRRD